ncbi:MAG TPA: arginine deiminase family protein [Longimicrobiales bacterium]|nr:arginine deiminase family protein [Longimicrobiales bacterium]
MTDAPAHYQSDSAPLRRVLLKHARDAWLDQPTVSAGWAALGYTAEPDFAAACRESDAFAKLLHGLGVEVAWTPAEGTGLDSLYVRDASVVFDRGAILCRMGKRSRRDEPEALGRAYEALGIRVAGHIESPGTLEGGDVAWLGARTVAVGRGYRTNDGGIRQLETLLADAVDEVVTVPLPHWRGPSDVFHLMSILSPVAHDLALVYSPLLPVPFRELLLERGIGLVEVADEEFANQGGNVLAVAPRVVVAVEGNPVTRRRLEAAGVEVHTYQGAEISRKGCGGPTCLTRPLERVRAGG